MAVQSSPTAVSDTIRHALAMTIQVRAEARESPMRAWLAGCGAVASPTEDPFATPPMQIMRPRGSGLRFLSAHESAAVDVDGLPGDPARLLGGEEHGDAGDLLRLCHA